MSTAAVFYDASTEFRTASKVAAGTSIAAMLLLVIAANMWVYVYSITILGITIELKSGYYKVEACSQSSCESQTTKPWNFDDGCEYRGLALIASAGAVVLAVIIHIGGIVAAIRIHGQKPSIKPLESLKTTSICATIACYMAFIALGGHIIFRDCGNSAPDDSTVSTGPALWMEWIAGILSSIAWWRTRIAIRRMLLLQASAAIAQPLNGEPVVVTAVITTSPASPSLQLEPNSPTMVLAARLPQQQYSQTTGYSGQQPAAQQHRGSLI